MTHPKTGSWNILDRIKTQTLVLLILHIAIFMGFLRGSDGKEFACNAGNPGAISGSGRSPGKGHGNSLQYSCLENSMDRGAWQAIVHGGRIESDMTEWLTYKHTHIHTAIFGLLEQHSGKELACQCRKCKRLRISPWYRKTPWRRKWQPTPVFLPEKPHGQKNLAGCSP